MCTTKLKFKLIISSQILFASFYLFNFCESAEVGLRKVRETETYSTRYDNVDVDAILASDRLLRNYINCLLDKGACTPEGTLLKKYLPDALLTECSKCSKKQKEIAGKVLAHLLQNHKDYWQQILDKYDKDGSFRRRHEELAPGEAEDYSDLSDAK